VKGWKVYAQAVKGMKNTLMIGHGTEAVEARKIFQGKILESVPNKEMKEYYSTSNMVICPFQNPGLSRVAMESMACGCIVIKSDIDPPPIVNGVNGFTFKYDSPDDLRRVITKSLNMNNNKTETMRKRARETIIKNYSSKTMVKKIVEMYRGVKWLRK
jgi:glycosyltransferase involved in cell wall biosynthesis